MMTERYSVRWNNYASQLTDAFGSLFTEEDLVDVTLSCEGKKIKAHKMLLSACSPYFREVFKENPCQHPVIVFRNVHFVDLKAIVDFIYYGEVNVLQEQFDSFLNTAAMLEVKGLTSAEEGEREISKNDEDNLQTYPDVDQATKSATDAETCESSGNSEPLAKRRKSDSEKQPVDDSVAVETISVINIKEEIDETTASEVPAAGESVSVQESTSVSPNNRTDGLQEPTSETEDCVIVKEVSSAEETPDSLSEPKTCVPVKRKTTQEERVPVKTVKKAPVKIEAKPAPPAKSTVKGSVQIPPGLIITPVTAAPQVEKLFDFPQESQVQDEAYAALRSEDATTPIQEDPTPLSQDLGYVDASQVQDAEVEPEIGEEAPALQEQTEPMEQEEEPEEPEFDYFGCEVCKTEGKPVDMERITFSHKCPICPYCCFCAHLLKEHMRVIHGWFNVQRRFKLY